MSWGKAFASGQTGAAILGGIAALVAIAAVLLFAIGPQAQTRPVMWIVGTGFVVAVLAPGLRDGAIIPVLKWYGLLVLVAWVGVLSLSRVSPDQPRLACLSNILDSCRYTTDQLAAQGNPPPPVRVDFLPAPPSAANYRVFVQFAGILDRGDVRAVMRRLRDAGWRIQGVEGGGERTGAAADLAEVRYSEPLADPLARQLADDLNATKLIAKTLQARIEPAR